MALEFSKPARLVGNHAHPEHPSSVPAHADLVDSGRPIGTGVGADPPPLPVTHDQALFRAVLARLLAADAQLRVVNPREHGLDTVERALQFTPDLVQMDVWVPEIVDAKPEHSTNPQSARFKVVVLAADFRREHAEEGSAPDVHQSEEVFPEGAASRIVALYATKAPFAPTSRPEVSKRELSVLSRVAAGMSNKQIGTLLGISQKTVRNHLTRIFQKLGANNRTEAVMNAVRLGLLTV